MFYGGVHAFNSAVPRVEPDWLLRRHAGDWFFIVHLWTNCDRISIPIRYIAHGGRGSPGDTVICCGVWCAAGPDCAPCPGKPDHDHDGTVVYWPGRSRDLRSIDLV